MKQHGKRILWTVGIVILCLSDQQIGSAMGERNLIFRIVPAIVLGLAGLSHYPVRSYLKPIYYIWAVSSLVVSAAVILFYDSRTYYRGRLYCNVILGAIYSLLLLRTLYALLKEKSRPSVNRKYLILFLVFLGLTLFSRYDDRLTVMYPVCLGILYLISFSSQEKKDLENAVTDGIIIGFFIIQGLAFVHRPFDTPRYLGMYSNTNINALLYQTAYCAFLGKYCLLERESTGIESAATFRPGTVRKWLCLLPAACMWGFVFLTMCRSAMISMALVTVIFWIRRLNGRRGKRLLGFAGCMVLYVAVTLLGLPLVYGAVRYLPSVFGRPLYFYEGYSEERVQPHDPWDSPKYTSWSDVVKQNLGRLTDLIPWLGENKSATECLGSLQEKTVAVGAFPEEAVQADRPPEKTVILEKSTHVRVKIYQYYASQLNLWGHKEEENGLQVNDHYYAPHAHNLFLQYAFHYGSIAGILFVLMVFAALKMLWSQGLSLFILYLSLFVFGMTEIMWRTGTLPYCLMYLIPLILQEPAGQRSKREGTKVVRKADI